jgi:malonyl-CoA O-methyltransferase
MPAGTPIAQRRQRAACGAKRARQGAQMRLASQPRQTAHCVGSFQREGASAIERVSGIGSIYFAAMPGPAASTTERRLDTVAVGRALERMGRRAEAPWLHAEAARRMAERLAVIRLQPQRIVEWSGFLGASDALLAAAYPAAQRIVVEPLRSIAERTRQAHRGVDVIAADDLAPAAAQLVWSNMLLHASRNPPALIARWQRALAADGFVMFSCLGPGTLLELRELYRRAGWGDAMSEFVDMHDLGDMLVQAGFADPVMDQETLTLTWATPQALLAELRSLGINASPDRSPGLRTPRWRARLESALESLADETGRLRLHFELAYGHAFKGTPRARGDAPTTVSLDEMRSLLRAGRDRP